MRLVEHTGEQSQHQQHHKQHQKTILVIGAAGGVGSCVLQMARNVYGLRVVGTASKPDSIAKAKEWGADHVIPHSNLKENLKKLNIDEVDYVFCTAHTEEYAPVLADILAPLAHVVFILSAPKDLPLASNGYFLKSIHIHFVMMFTRTMFQRDVEHDGHILRKVAEWADKKLIVPCISQTLDFWTQLRDAHKTIEEGKSMGKIVLKL